MITPARLDACQASLDDLHRRFDLFEESKHPREASGENAGQFTAKGGSSGSGVTSHLTASPDRSKWPAHVKKLKVPPAWTDVRISQNPKAALQATGRDAKGRPQYIYSERFKAGQAAAKFKRVKALDAKFDRLSSQVQKDINGRDKVRAEHAQITSLIMDIGLRPGSEKDTGAEKQAYGATTLTGDHVVVSGKEVRLKFVGKKGVDLDLPVTDSRLASELRARKTSAGSGQLFPGVTSSSLRKYVGGLAGGAGFHTKDLRTLRGTRIASEAVQSMAAPTSASAYKRAVRQVAQKVADRLGNSVTVALQSYISPVVFAPWRASIGEGGGKTV